MHNSAWSSPHNCKTIRNLSHPPQVDWGTSAATKKSSWETSFCATAAIHPSKATTWSYSFSCWRLLKAAWLLASSNAPKRPSLQNRSAPSSLVYLMRLSSSSEKPSMWGENSGFCLFWGYENNIKNNQPTSFFRTPQTIPKTQRPKLVARSDTQRWRPTRRRRRLGIPWQQWLWCGWWMDD